MTESRKDQDLDWEDTDEKAHMEEMRNKYSK